MVECLVGNEKVEGSTTFLGAIFCSKKEIPAKPWQLVRANFFKLLTEIPPRAMTGLLLKRERDLNLFIPK